MLSMTSSEVAAALEKIAAKHDGKLDPGAVVAAASPKTSVLHQFFCWDDDKAAELYRLCQARRLIRVQVHYIPTETREVAVRAWASLESQRTHGPECQGEDAEEPSGSYHPIQVVMQDDTLRAEFLEQCKADAKRFAAKYRTLAAAADVISAIDRLCK